MAELAASVLGFVLTLLLHASVLLGTVWLLERIGVLSVAARAEWAWRGALFGALLSAGLAAVGPGRSVNDLDPDRGDRALASAPSVPATSVATAPARPVDALPPSVNTKPVDESVSPREPDTSPTTFVLPEPLIRTAVSLWLSAALAMLLLLLARAVAVYRLQRRAARWPDASLTQMQDAAALAPKFALSSPPLRRASRLDMPVALPDGSVLLPDWSAGLSRVQSRALIAHEFAHLRRRDPWWRIAQQLALVPLCLHPLAWFATRRLDALAERRADALAARVLGDGRALAECLAHCLAQRNPDPVRAPRFALAMAERPGAVVDRVQHLLEDDPMNDTALAPRRTGLAIALGLLACLSLPGIAVVALAGTLGSGQSISVRSGDDGVESVDIAVAKDGYRLDVEMEGKVSFAPDESDVTALAADAELEIAETLDGVSRSISFERDGDAVARDYRVDGEKRAFDADDRAWLARVLPEIFRSSGIDAEERSKRILARGGSDALLDEIELIRSDYGRGRYLGLLYSLGSLDATQQSRALELMRAIESDYELRQALTQALDSSKLDRGQLHQVLDLALELDSDYERAELLVDTAARFAFDDASFPHWAKAVEGIGSDYEHRRVLEALLARADEHPGAIALAFEAAAEIGSDYEKRALLEAGLAHARGDARLHAQYLAVAATIGSDYDRKEALLALFGAGPVDAPLALAALEAIADIGSDHECKEALVALAQVMPAEAAVIDAYRAVARRLSTYERGEAEQALDRRVVAL